MPAVRDRIAAIGADPRARRAAFVGTAILLTVTVVGWATAVVVAPTWFADSFAIDFGIYMDAFDRVAAGESWYQDRQLHGPYEIALGDVLYPPMLLYLLAPFRFLGPWPWWIVPALIVAAVVWRHRPGPWAWLAVAVCLAWPVTPAKFVFGNPVIWGAAAVALGTIYRWPAAFALIKPTVAVFALIGIRDRRWWFAVAAMGIASLPFLADTLLYPQVLLDAKTNPVDGRGGPLYSLQEFPLMAIPVIARLGRRRGSSPS